MNLQLSLIRKWFEMTKVGVKMEDYREVTPYFCRMLLTFKGFKRSRAFWKEVIEDVTSHNIELGVFKFIDFDQNIMTLGYPKSTDTSRILKYEHAGIEIREGKQEWGAEKGKIYFVIKHGKKILTMKNLNKIIPCGGCGNDDPSKRCIGCGHDFYEKHEIKIPAREIKFKAKNKKGDWITGMPTYDLKYIFNDGQLDSVDRYEIIPETLCQYSGMKDKNGVEIYEGDICKCRYYKHSEKDLYLTQKVVFEHASFYVVVGDLKPDLETETYSNCPLSWVNELEIIGNIHD